MKIDKDVPDGTVLMLGISYPGLVEDADKTRGRTMPKVWTYVGLKVAGLWYFTGSGKVPQAAGWGAVERWLARDNRQLAWVKQASGWDHLWPVGEAIEAPASPFPAGPSCYALDEPETVSAPNPGGEA